MSSIKSDSLRIASKELKNIYSDRIARMQGPCSTFVCPPIDISKLKSCICSLVPFNLTQAFVNTPPRMHQCNHKCLRRTISSFQMFAEGFTSLKFSRIQAICQHQIDPKSFYHCFTPTTLSTYSLFNKNGTPDFWQVAFRLG